MDALEEVVGGPKDLSHIVKGKRTKRFRPHSPISFTMITSTTPPHSSAGDSDNVRCPTSVVVYERNNVSAATAGVEALPVGVDAPTEEDEDMARCLMLLAQGGGDGGGGGGGASRHHAPKEEEGAAFNNNNAGGGIKFCSKKYIETTTVGGGGGVKVGMYVYECKTCGRTFPTFQALGGHRTSHTKEKPPLTIEAAAGKRPLSLYDDGEDVNPSPPFNKAAKITPLSSLHFYDPAKSSPRIHECSYCGAEFTSGQALGGHMRRHRGGASTAASPASSSFEKRVPQKDLNNGKCLNLDLNLAPAGEENNHDHRRRGHELPENQERQPPSQIEPTLFLSTTPPLVGCKYI